MGIKMGAASDSAGIEWNAKDYAKGKGKEPLHCVHCPVQITHQSAHTRERDDKPHLVPAYFRLLPGGRHADGCKHAVSDEIKSIASESKDIFESLQNGQYRLRLVMIRDALTGLGKKPSGGGDSAQGRRTGKTYERSKNILPGYINSGKRVLQLRALCDSSDEIAEHLELVFEGNTIVPWSQFYFEAEDYLQAFHNLSRNTVEHPIAIHGTVKLVRPVPGKWGPTNVLNLVKPKYIADTNNPELGIGIEASVWCDNAEWFGRLNEGDEIVVLGMWKAKAGEPKASSSPKYRFKSFTTHKLSVTPVLLAQIARVPSRPA
jgi:hypothetical protein